MRRLLTTLGLILTLAAGVAAAQDKIRWYRVTPEGQEFTVLMPDVPVRVRREIPLAEGGMITPPIYELTSGGILFSVIAFDKSGAASAPNADAAVEILRRALSKAGEGNSLTSERNAQAGGTAVKQYALRAGGADGTARAYEAKDHVYIVMTLGARAGSVRADNFFNSFSLDPASAAGPSLVPYERVDFPLPAAPAPLWPVKGTSAMTLGNRDASTPGVYLGKSAGESDRKTVSGAVVNGRAIHRATPEYPPIAKQARAQGDVIVQLTVDEEGYVIAAAAVSGHPLLQQAAVRAVKQYRFEPTLLDGVPVKVMGRIVVTFTLQ